MSESMEKPWLFLGLGNVLFNEDPAYAQIYLMMYNILQSKDESITFEKLLEERDELIKEGHILPLKTLMHERLSDDESSNLRLEFRTLLEEDWLKYNPLNPEVENILKKLREKYYLGIIANAPAFVRAILQDLNLLNMFQVVLISEEVGLPKPNRGIFLQALEEAKTYAENNGCGFSHEHCVLVGDSLEQDIIPGKELGMITVLLRWDLNEKYKKSDLLSRDTFEQYFSHLQSYSSRRRAPKSDDEKPDYMVTSLLELEKILMQDNFLKTAARR